MKKVAFGSVLIAIMILTIVIGMSLYGRQSRTVEIRTALSSSMDSALSSVMGSNQYKIENKEEFVAAVLESLVAQIGSESQLTVKILRADYTKGILSIEVTEKFKHPNGAVGTVTDMRTVIFDKDIPAKKSTYTVSYYADGELYKSYTLESGSEIPYPATSNIKKFICWENESNTAYSGITTTSSANNTTKKILGDENGNILTATKDLTIIAQLSN